MNHNNYINNIRWDKYHLIPSVTQDYKTNKVLMLAYINKESMQLSMDTGIMHYFSRSKNRIWKKGEESGNIQAIKEIYIDCDGDAVLFIVDQTGSACHTGSYSCFYKKIDALLQSIEINDIASKPTYNVIDDLYHILESKKLANKNASYTALMYSKGENAICKKIVEEAGELAFAIKDKNADDIIHECSDLIYHTLLGLCYVDISPDRVMQELRRRFSQSGIVEKIVEKNNHVEFIFS